MLNTKHGSRASCTCVYKRYKWERAWSHQHRRGWQCESGHYQRRGLTANELCIVTQSIMLRL